jgi:glycosyltransferase involved in cell wall biosynthesis
VPTHIDEERIIRDLPDSDRLLHVAGHRAAGDRNGLHVIGALLNQITHPWRVASQDGYRLNPRVLGHVELASQISDRWALYDDCGILVSPRRYGGQSLVVNEAMARGLAVVMTDCSPNIQTWPILPIPCRPGGWVNTPGGRIQMHMILTRPLIDTLRILVADREQLERWQTRSVMWARDNTWTVWEPKIRALLADV